MPKIKVDVDEDLLAVAAEQLGTITSTDTVEMALRVATATTCLARHAEDAVDIANADLAMEEPGETISLEQAEIELDEMVEEVRSVPESEPSDAEFQLLQALKSGLLADLDSADVLRSAQR